MTPDQKGSIAETAIVHAAVKLGIGVLKPLTDGHRYDVVFDVAGKLLRVQCKWGARRGDVIVVPFRSCRRSRNGFVRRSYTADEVDGIAAYCLELDATYYLPLDRFFGRACIQLRLNPTHNNQRVGINWAQDFEFERLNWADLGP
jgi:hypothetical protein